LSLVCVALAAFVGTCSAATYMYTAQYVLRNREVFPSSHVTGTVYYYYDEDVLLNSRVRFDTSYVLNENTITSSELYHYKNQALYNLCTACTADTLKVDPEKWWGVADETCTTEEDGYQHCTRRAYAAVNVAEFWYKGTPGTADFDVKYVKFKDGRELTLSGFSGSSKSYSTYSNKLEITSSMNCPEPVCKSYVDLVFVLDSSSSVDTREWSKTQEFVRTAVSNFKIDGAGNAYVGIVDFSAPDKTCSKRDCDERAPNKKCASNCGTKGHDWGSWNNNCGDGWHTRCCNNGKVARTTVPLKKGGSATRYIEDCMFDEKCYPDSDTTAEVLLNLTHEQVMDKVSKIEKMAGHTCQRYGLIQAYNMLFENNPRCPKGSNRTECPIPIVIVVTDGEDLCHNSTMVWAEKIKAADDRGLLLEVGVGLQADYDEEYIRNLSSTLPGTDAALSVDDYSQISSVLDNMITPVCELAQSSATGGSACAGFWACGACYCPLCDSDEDDACHHHECTSPENGCIQKDRVCNNATLTASKCYRQWCDPTDPSESCRAEMIDCKAIMEAELNRSLFACEVAECIDRVGCSVTTNDAFCQSVSPVCKVGKCTPSAPEDEFGCSFSDFVCPDHIVNNCETYECTQVDGQDTCIGEKCVTTNCHPIDPVTRLHYDLCQPKEEYPCGIIECNEEGEYSNPLERCSYTEMPNNTNMCLINTCNTDTNEIVVKRLVGDLDPCRKADNKCYTYGCDPNANDEWVDVLKLLLSQTLTQHPIFALFISVIT